MHNENLQGIDTTMNTKPTSLFCKMLLETQISTAWIKKPIKEWIIMHDILKLCSIL